MNLLASEEDLDQLLDGSSGQSGDSEDGDAPADTGDGAADAGDGGADAGEAVDYSLPSGDAFPPGEDGGTADYPGWASGEVMSFAKLAVEDLPPASDEDGGGGDVGVDPGDVTTGLIAVDWIVPDDWTDDGWVVDDGSGGDDTGGDDTGGDGTGDGTDDGSGWDDSYDDPVDDGSGGDGADGGDDAGGVDPDLPDDGPVVAGDFGDGAICVLYLPVDVIL